MSYNFFVELSRGRCTGECEFCPGSSLPAETISTTDIVNFLSELQRINLVNSITFTGFGEPSQHPEFETIITSLHSAEVNLLQLDTNALKFYSIKHLLPFFKQVSVNVYPLLSIKRIDTIKAIIDELDSQKVFYKLIGVESFVPEIISECKSCQASILKLPLELFTESFIARTGASMKTYSEVRARFCDFRERTIPRLYIGADGSIRKCVSDSLLRVQMPIGNITNPSSFIRDMPQPIVCTGIEDGYCKFDKG